MNHTPDITDDPRLAGLDAFDSATERHASNIEDRTDILIDRCRDLAFCIGLNAGRELGYGDLLPKMMQAVAAWTGSSENAVVQMRALYNILADELQKIAECEVTL